MGIVTDWTKYAPYFTRKEFECKHTGKCEMDEEFMGLLLKLRKELNEPMEPSSGYRHWTHPVEIRKGHKNGEHTKGRCADIRCDGPKAFRIMRLALKLGFTRIGVNQTGTAGRFIHLGLGTSSLPNNTVWSY